MTAVFFVSERCKASFCCIKCLMVVQYVKQNIYEIIRMYFCVRRFGRCGHNKQEGILFNEKLILFKLSANAFSETTKCFKPADFHSKK